MKGKLVQIKSSHDRLRTKEIIGEYEQAPEVGKGFTLFSHPLDEKMYGGVRLIHTSPVQYVEQAENCTRFSTANSTYELYEEKA